MAAKKKPLALDRSVRKTFILDTSVLLYDKHALTSFPGNDVVIPLVVLDELDRHKDKHGVVGENARFVNRFLDSFREKKESLSEGVNLSEIDQTIRVEIMKPSNIPQDLDPGTGDNRIISLALDIKRSVQPRKPKNLGAQEPETPVIVITKDINFRVKCDALGLLAEDYLKDNVARENLPGEIQEIPVEDSVIDSVFLKKEIYVKDLLTPVEYHPCEPVILKGQTKKSALAVITEGVVKLVPTVPKMSDLVRIKPRNKEQTFALHMMLDPDITLVTLTGIAGSGKTFLALMAGLSGIYDKRFKRIVITRPIQPVGKDLGFLPGDINDKMSVWIKPIADNFREGVGDKETSYFDMMQDKGQIEIAPLPYIRGRTFNDSFIIVDEAQNATIHELKTIITRVGQNSKIVLLGDIDQVDTPYLDTFSNGLSIAVDRFKDQEIAGHVSLPKSERSDLAAIASKIL
jgi:PhoH-like ATPase